MKEKINAGEIIKIGIILFLITAIAAALLAFVNGKTAPLIEKNSIEKEQNAMRAVMPDAELFKETEISPEIASLSDSGEISKIYTAADADGNAVGVCVITETTGYDVGIQTVTGVNLDLTVSGIDIISMNETPGLGAKASEESFRSQYVGKSGEIGVSKSAASDTEIQAISGATKTSNGVTRGVNIALKTAELVLGAELEGGDK